MRIVQSICNYLQLTNHMSSKFRLHWEALAFYPVCILLFFHFEWYYIVWWYCIHNLWSPWQTIGMIFRGKLLIHHIFWSMICALITKCNCPVRELFGDSCLVLLCKSMEKQLYDRFFKERNSWVTCWLSNNKNVQLSSPQWSKMVD